MATRDLEHTHEEMIRKLEGYGMNHGFAVLGTAVVIVGPGAPFNVYATWFAAADLEKAVEAGILEKRRLSGSFVLDMFAIGNPGSTPR
jgi:hypothetical protein